MKPDFKETAANAENLEELRENYLWSVQQRDASIFRRQKLNFDTRNCIWAGQSDDGKKYKRNYNREVFPWEGASDARVPLVDKYILEDVAFLMVLWSRMRTMVSGVESGDDQFASRLTNFLRWMKYNQMEESADEAELLASYMLEQGNAVLGVFWAAQEQLAYQTIDLETIQAAALQAQKQSPGHPLAQLPALILDPSQIETALDMAAEFLPDLKRSKVRRVIEELRRDGHSRFPKPYLVKNRPELVAFCPNQDFFIPPDATDIQKASALHRVELISEAILRERIRSYDWDEKWVYEVIENQRGRTTAQIDSQRLNPRNRTQNLLDFKNLFEVIHSYRRLSDEEGVPGIYYTCWHRNITKSYSFHDLLNYEHGKYPFVHFKLEKRSRWIDDSRGYGERAATWQQQIKVQWDSRIDRASIATLPPSHHPPGEAPAAWGPGVKIPTIRPDTYGFMEIPRYDIGSKEVEESVRNFADEYFGRPVDEQNVVTSQTMRQHLGNAWMNCWKQADTQLLQLCQQFMPEEFYYRVVGSMKGKSIKATREEIQGAFDIVINYNVQDLDPEYIQKKIQLVERALQMDVNGIIDRDEALVWVFDMVDPNSGERLLKPAEAAQQQQVEDEQNVFARLFAGIPVDIKPGQAYSLRLQVLQNIMRQNPTAQKRYEEDQRFREVVDKRIQQLEFQLQQRQNAIIGRLGA